MGTLNLVDAVERVPTKCSHEFHEETVRDLERALRLRTAGEPERVMTQDAPSVVHARSSNWPH